jgi:nucleotide-binding universal stress UspA family protein
MKKIVVATDFSPQADRALEVALELARSLDGQVTLLHAWELPVNAYANGVGITPSPEMEREIVTRVERDLGRLREQLAKRGITVETHHVMGPAADEIVRFAETRGMDLVVIGTHGRRGLRRLVLGSVAEAVVRRAELPVLTVSSKGVTAKVQ